MKKTIIVPPKVLEEDNNKNGQERFTLASERSDGKPKVYHINYAEYAKSIQKESFNETKEEPYEVITPNSSKDHEKLGPVKRLSRIAKLFK